MRVLPSQKLRGRVKVPGDKSVTIRAYFLGLMHPVIINNESVGRDCRSALKAVRSFGAIIKRYKGSIKVSPPTNKPENVKIDAGNSATTARFSLAWAASSGISAEITGDENLCSRKVGELEEDLVSWGASVKSNNGYFPVFTKGKIEKDLNLEIMPGSGTRKGALLIASANTGLSFSWKEKPLSRDHSERLYSWADCWPKKTTSNDPVWIDIPPDASAFAVLAGLASLTEGSSIYSRVLTNKRRTGFLRLVEKLGGNLNIVKESEWPESIGTVTSSFNNNNVYLETIIESQELMDMIDEVPLAAILCSNLNCKVTFKTDGILGNKESNRLTSSCDLVNSFGGDAEIIDDDLIVYGKRGSLTGGILKKPSDHRIVLAAAVAGASSKGGVEIENPEIGNVAFPGWINTFKSLGVAIE